MPGQVAARVAGWERTRGSWPVQRVTGPATVTFTPGTPLLISVKIALGTDLTTDPLTWVWTDITSYVRYSPGITVTTGRADESFTTTPGTARLTLNNRDGRFSRKNPMGPYYGQLTRNTPIWVTIDPGTGAYDLVRMFVNEWPGRWDKTSTDFTVPIVCGGIMRRLQQGATPLSPLNRYFKSVSPQPLAWWPLEDGAHATKAASGVAGGSPMTAAGSPGFNSGTPVNNNVFGTDSYVSLANGSSLSGVVPAGTSSPVAWQIVAIARADPNLAGVDIVVLSWTTPTGSFIRYELAHSFATSSTFVRAYTAAGVATTLCNAGFVGGQQDFDEIKVSAVQSGSNVVTELWIGGLLWATQTSAGTLGRINVMTLNPNRTVINPDVDTITNVANDFLVSHIAVFDQTDSTIGTQYATPDAETGESSTTAPFFQWNGESARNRMVRICAERDILFTGTVGPTIGMGPQRTMSDLDLLRECEAADLGVLYERGFGLGYQALVERYNAPAAMTLDYTNGDLSESPEPTDDDQRLHNSWTVTRTRGSSATSTDSASVAAEGRYDDSATLNVAFDDFAQYVADWLVHVGTSGEMRWPSIALRFDNAAGRQLIPQWVALSYGARINVLHPPYQATSDPIDAFIEGRTERVDQFTWTAQISTTPAQPFEVFQLDGTGNRSRLELAQALAADVDSNDVTLSVATATANLPLLTTISTDFPFDVDIGGERVTVTAVSGSSSPQSATVVRSVNGVVKSHDAGATIRLWKPGGLSL